MYYISALCITQCVILHIVHALLQYGVCNDLANNTIVVQMYNSTIVHGLPAAWIGVCNGLGMGTEGQTRSHLDSPQRPLKLLLNMSSLPVTTQLSWSLPAII